MGFVCASAATICSRAEKACARCSEGVRVVALALALGWLGVLATVVAESELAVGFSRLGVVVSVTADAADDTVAVTVTVVAAPGVGARDFGPGNQPRAQPAIATAATTNTPAATRVSSGRRRREGADSTPPAAGGVNPPSPACGK